MRDATREKNVPRLPIAREVVMLSRGEVSPGPALRSGAWGILRSGESRMAESRGTDYVERHVMSIASRVSSSYIAPMRKTTIVIDDELLNRAQKILGTRGLKATIDRALLEVIDLDARRQVVAQLRSMDGLDLDRQDVMEKAWR